MRIPPPPPTSALCLFSPFKCWKESANTLSSSSLKESKLLVCIITLLSLNSQLSSLLKKGGDCINGKVSRFSIAAETRIIVLTCIRVQEPSSTALQDNNRYNISVRGVVHSTHTGFLLENIQNILRALHTSKVAGLSGMVHTLISDACVCGVRVDLVHVHRNGCCCMAQMDGGGKRRNLDRRRGAVRTHAQQQQAIPYSREKEEREYETAHLNTKSAASVCV